MIGSFNVECPGCGVLLTEDNAGGYRCYCATCVDAMPPLPDAPKGTGFQLVGQYPLFSWQPVIESLKPLQFGPLHDEDIPQ